MADDKIWKKFLEAVKAEGQVKVAERLGVHQTTVSGWILGDHAPSKLALDKMRQVFS